MLCSDSAVSFKIKALKTEEKRALKHILFFFNWCSKELKVEKTIAAIKTRSRSGSSERRGVSVTGSWNQTLDRLPVCWSCQKSAESRRLFLRPRRRLTRETLSSSGVLQPPPNAVIYLCLSAPPPGRHVCLRGQEGGMRCVQVRAVFSGRVCVQEDALILCSS